MLPFWRPALVVDDCPSAAHIMCQMLERLGFAEVPVRHSAEEALVELKRRRHAFALIDIEMRPVSGLEMLERIRGTKGIRTTPVLLTTASPMSALPPVQPASRIATTSFILKPFSAGDLKRKLSEMFEKPYANQELLPSEMAKRYDDWAPSGRRGALETTLLTRIRRVQFD